MKNVYRVHGRCFFLRYNGARVFTRVQTDVHEPTAVCVGDAMTRLANDAMLDSRVKELVYQGYVIDMVLVWDYVSNSYTEVMPKPLSSEPVPLKDWNARR